jgi:hypothetical protein
MPTRRSHRAPDRDDASLLDPDLRSLDQAFAAAAPDFLADGRYHVRVEQVELRPSRFSAEPLLRWILRRVDAPDGPPIFKNHVIRAAGLHVLKKDLRLCGLELERLSELTAHLDELRDHELEITLRTVGGYQRVYFERSLLPLTFPP